MGRSELADSGGVLEIYNDETNPLALEVRPGLFRDAAIGDEHVNLLDPAYYGVTTHADFA